MKDLGVRSSPLRKLTLRSDPEGEPCRGDDTSHTRTSSESQRLQDRKDRLELDSMADARRSVLSFAYPETEEAIGDNEGARIPVDHVALEERAAEPLNGGGIT